MITQTITVFDIKWALISPLECLFKTAFRRQPFCRNTMKLFPSSPSTVCVCLPHNTVGILLKIRTPRNNEWGICYSVEYLDVRMDLFKRQWFICLFPLPFQVDTSHRHQDCNDYVKAHYQTERDMGQAGALQCPCHAWKVGEAASGWAAKSTNNLEKVLQLFCVGSH